MQAKHVGFACVLLLTRELLGNELKLKDLLVLAAKNSQEVNIAKTEYDISELSVVDARSSFLPQLNLGSSHGLGDSHPATNSTKWDSSFNLALVETIYDDGKQILNYKSSKLENQASKLRLDLVRATHFLTVADAYYDLAAIKKNDVINSKKLAVLKKQFSRITNRYRNGQTKKEDYLRFKTQLDISKLTSQRSKSQVKRFLSRLENLLGTKLSNAVVHAPKVSSGFMSNLPTNTALSLESHYLYKIFELEKKKDFIALKLAKKPRYPELALVAAANYGADSYIDTGFSVDDRDSLTWKLALQLDYTLWDNGVIKRNILIQRKKLAVNQLNRDQSLESIVEQQQNIQIDYKLEKSALMLNKQIFDSATSTFEVIKKNYRYGEVTYLDYLDTITELFDSESSYVNSYFDLKKLYARTLFHRGVLNEGSLLD